jgi:Transcriptional regulators containing a DNA-binding HTH domain and an aminotransferase domain (MocR family) and their eukaryotic orthologs
MLPFDTLITIDKTLSVSVYQQIANQILMLIKNGIVKSGSYLPGTRELARMVVVHRKTIIAAYNELSAQGWITVIPRKGFIVVPNLPEVQPQQWDQQKAGFAYESSMPSPFYKTNQYGVIPLASDTMVHELIIDDGHPDMRLAPMDLLNREYRSRLKKVQTFKRVSATLAAGSFNLRETMISHMAQTRGLQAQASNIMMTHGAQMSIYIAASLLLKPGDNVIVGEPGYFVANQVFESLGANVIRMTVDQDGINTDLIATACQKLNIRMLYLVPHHHHPTTVTLSPQRRMRILELAEEHNFTIVEDDYDYDFHYSSSPYLPLASGNHQNRVVYIGSFSKSLSTSIRIGFMIASADFIAHAVHIRRLIDLKGDHIMEDSLAALIENGDINRYLKKNNKIYKERRDHLIKMLDTYLKGIVSYEKPDGGMAIWVKFDPNYPIEQISIKAARQGLYMNNGKLFDNNGVSYNAIRFGFASLTLPEITKAVQIISSSLVLTLQPK